MMAATLEAKRDGRDRADKEAQITTRDTTIATGISAASR